MSPLWEIKSDLTSQTHETEIEILDSKYSASLPLLPLHPHPAFPVRALALPLSLKSGSRRIQHEHVVLPVLPPSDSGGHPGTSCPHSTFLRPACSSFLFLVPSSSWPSIIDEKRRSVRSQPGQSSPAERRTADERVQRSASVDGRAYAALPGRREADLRKQLVVGSSIQPLPATPTDIQTSASTPAVPSSEWPSSAAFLLLLVLFRFLIPTHQPKPASSPATRP
jgi:hypothetical protein